MEALVDENVQVLGSRIVSSKLRESTITNTNAI